MSSGVGPPLKATIVAAALAIAVVACGGGDSDSGTANGAENKGVITVVDPMVDDFYIQELCGVRDKAAELGYEVKHPETPKTWDPTLQIPILNAAIAGQPDAIIVVPTEPKALVPPLKQAKADGIEVVTVDQPLADDSLRASFIASNNVEGGAAAADELAKQIGESGKVVVISNLPQGTSTERKEGFEQGIEKYPGIEYLGTKFNPKATPEEATATMAAVIRRDPDVKGVFTVNDQMAQGVVTALADAGLTDKVRVIDFDASSIGVSLLKEGKISGLVAQLPREMGRLAVEQVDNALNDRPTESTIQPPFTIVNADNLNDPKIQSLLYSPKC